MSLAQNVAHINNITLVKGGSGDTPGDVADEDGSPEKKQCSSCGRYVSKLYQQNMCKACLVDSFSRLRTVIDNYR